MKNNKKTVVYSRTATRKQSLKHQLEAAKPFVKDIPEEDLLFIEDHGASSSKRNGLQKLLDLISTNQVDKLIAYSRDRLTRSEDEYQAILKLLYAHGVKVVFSAKGTLPFHHDQNSGMVLEMLNLQIINMEKDNMSERIKAALKHKKEA